MRESVIKWRNEETEENGRELWYWLRWWIRSSEIERRTENSPSVGEIGWREGNIWHPIPLVPQFPLAHPPQYEFSASRLRDGEWETIVGTQIEGFTRWSMDIVLGENIHLHTYVRSNRTNEIAELFVASALSLPKDLGVDVRSLRQVSRTGFDVYASLTILEDRASTVHYFAYPLRPNGSVLDPPGFWSLCPYPSRSERHLQADDAELCFHVGSILHYQSINDRILSVLQNLESHSFLPVPHITYASDPPFASITEVSHQRSPSPTIAMHPKKRFCDALLSAFSKKRKISHS
ncbi:hypothetical protein SISSUDRAFT_476050 [Sistotremastrum suecicum HHB10207 ss-3]|uniref:Uncharacterized protein n=1 Tax=Sistotremastrum suecicum HHB10207 ss-3 TaxID=1314776 RepID=A0A165Y2Z6_9AGAM|nr:hypothetical protein SISSUDRAFT_476050 [Sistotremastrum suecicum HHB10207 ss-3]